MFLAVYFLQVLALTMRDPTTVQVHHGLYLEGHSVDRRGAYPRGHLYQARPLQLHFDHRYKGQGGYTEDCQRGTTQPRQEGGTARR